VTNTKERAEDTCPIVYQCRLSLSTRTVNHLADLLRRHLKAIPSRWRILAPGKIAVIVLAALRHDQRLADMASGSNVSESTVRRWRDELIGLLAAQAPRLDRALKKIAKKGGEAVLKMKPTASSPSDAHGFAHLKNWRISLNSAPTLHAPLDSYALCSS
jgi:hypothetical protein